VEQQRSYPVHYRPAHWQLVPDLIVDGTIIVDPKSGLRVNDTHIAQMLGLPHITGLEVAVLLNFKESTLAYAAVKRRTTDCTDDTDEEWRRSACVPDRSYFVSNPSVKSVKSVVKTLPQ